MECRVCSSRRLEQFLDLGNQPHCDSLLLPKDLDCKEPYYPLQVCFCQDCTTVQINYTVPKETMFGEYLYVSGTTETLQTHFKQTTEKLISRLGLKAGDLVVDIGSNDGTWLACYQPHAIRTLGIDGAKNLAEMANARGVETWARFFNVEVARDVIAQKGRAQLVTAAGVFFHLEELHSVTEGIAEIIRDGGVFCVQAISLGEMLKFNQFDQVYHEHLTYWTIRSLERLFDMHGLEIFSAELLPIHGGSLELLVAPKGRQAIDPSVGKMRAEEEALGAGRIETYQTFAKRVWEIQDALLPILKSYAREGKKVHALGAPAKGGTLLNSFHISTELVQCATEVNLLKVGKYIPGVRIPIVDERLTAAPDAYLVLPWNFLKEFLRKKKDYILNGGAFIVPIPKPVIIDKSNYHQFA
jgi:2-polyprenyl-3-methyl-5-hydroxy-6-metoxy-1,4-benzoquinol methylase